jgi:homoserine O-acetyltransferase
MSTSAWQPGDPVGGRHFAALDRVDLEAGAQLTDVRIAYQTWGSLAPDASNAVLVLHALTGDSHVDGPAGPGHPTPGWWPGLLGPGAPLDTDRWFVVAPNVLGGCQGSTGPSSAAADGRAYGSRFPAVTIRDQVGAEVALADVLGIPSWAAVLGGSMGGMRALEWAVGHPERVRSALILATGARATADQIGTQSAQILAVVSDPRWSGGDYHPGGGPVAGLGIARRIAHLTYRTERELESRFSNRPQGRSDPVRGGQFAVQSYLDHQADKLAARFDAGSYVTLTAAMNSHDVGRDRGGVTAALAACPVPMVVAGIDTDRLYPLHLQEEIADAAAGCRKLQVLTSDAGHDGFLLEVDAVGELVRETLTLG